MKRIVVAIDGPAGSGKSTVARRVADRLGATYIDTGAMYRSVALWALRSGYALDDGARLSGLAEAAEIHFEPGTRRVELNGEDVTEAIRTTEVAEASSRVAAIPGVRRALVEKQRQMAEGSSVVMEGRDIGTVVLPEADVKVFLDASAEIRSGRRQRELKDAGAEPSGDLARHLARRDRRDASRSVSPLMQAPDAIYLDSSRLSIEEVEEAVLEEIRKRTSNGSE